MARDLAICALKVKNKVPVDADSAFALAIAPDWHMAPASTNLPASSFCGLMTRWLMIDAEASVEI